MKKHFLMISLVIGVVGLIAGLAYAQGWTSPAITIDVTVASPTLSVTMLDNTDDSSLAVTAGEAGTIVFAVDTDYPEFMIAPDRVDIVAGETNWHALKISAEGPWDLKVSGADTAGTKIIGEGRLRYWYSGTYAGYDTVTTVPINTKDTTNDWKLNVITTSPREVFTAVDSVIGAKTYMQYQLDIGGIGAGTYGATVTYTVTDSGV